MKTKRKLKYCFLACLLAVMSCSKGPQSDIKVQTGGSKEKAGTSAVPLPGGRAYYVVSLMGGTYPNKWVRICQYTFTAGTGTTGTVTEQFKYYTQSQSGDHYSNKVPTGFNTSQAICSYTCPVKTCIGYEPGQAWKTLSGTYFINVNGVLCIT